MSVVDCNLVCFVIDLEFGYVIEIQLFVLWLKDGEIIFENIFLSYSREGLRVLKDILFIVYFWEWFGIVGRLGVGKLFIVYVLFWMVECCGKIIVDGVKINNFDF